MLSNRVDWKRLWIYLAFAFGIAWITGLVIYLTGGLVNSRQLAPNFTLATILLATGYMWAPALANIFTRLLTHESFANAGIRPFFRRGWPYWVIGLAGPGCADHHRRGPLLPVSPAVLRRPEHPQAAAAGNRAAGNR